MGDLRPWSPEPNGAVLEERERERERQSSSSPSVDLSAIGAEFWQRAAAATNVIIAQVRPTIVSEERRKAVIDYVQRLIRNSIGCEVFPFGSVPLKTYLPDGDIDLTAFGGIHVDEALANDVYSVLQREDQSKVAEFVVKDVQLIRAEVKLVKCLVQNIVVDISFNQLGGLCTLCFLEQVDGLIGKDHLFKRSIILIKAWCYYESRILGAHHGLISTYALETLVLYIFHFFHSSLNDPLAVLYKFLDYFSKFEWEKYCISLNGLVRISSLPEFVVETPENGACDLLLSNDFLKTCVETFSVPTRGLETNSRTFPPKHLNIVDPLKENNNLGRSVSKGNFYRIRSAFIYGARKLGRILSQPEENVAYEIRHFFSNTLDRHGSGQRPDVQDPVPVDGQSGCGVGVIFQGIESSQEDWTNCESTSADSSGVTREHKLEGKQSFNGGVNGKAPQRHLSFRRTINDGQNSANGTSIAENRLSGDAKDLATTRIQCLSISSDAFKSSAQSSDEAMSPSPRGKAFHAPHLYFSSMAMENGKMRNEKLGLKQENPGFSIDDSAVRGNLDDSQLISNRVTISPVGSTNHSSLFSSVSCSSEDLGSSASIRAAGNPDATTSLANLSGDYESHINSLHNGQIWYEYVSNASVPSSSPTLLALQCKNSWDVIRQSVQFRHNMFSPMSTNGAATRPIFYHMKHPLIHGAAFGIEELPKTRGTGTYFPNTNHYRDRSLAVRGRNQSQMRSPRNNGRSSANHDTTLPEKNGCESSQTQFHNYQGGGKSGSPDFHHSGSSESKPFSSVNGSLNPSERTVESGSVEHAPQLLAETSWHPNPISPTAQKSVVHHLPTAEKERPISFSAMDEDRFSEKSYQLKDEDDFPPLSEFGGKVGSPVSTVKKLEKAER